MRLIYLLGTLLLASPGLADGAARVRILESDGTLFGVLTSSPGNESLSLNLPDGTELQAGACIDEQMAMLPSPDGTREAVVVERNCGATVDFATRVTLSAGQRQVPLVVLAGRPQVKLAWEGDKALEVHHSEVPADDIFTSGADPAGVAVTFIADLEPVGPSKYLDASSLNFGATGRAAGMPRELLLRLAGWSQEASGLHRAEWGTWSADPPYGDDPLGAARVLEGIEYYEKNYSPQQ